MISCKDYVELHKNKLKELVSTEREATGNVPCLAIVQVGDNPQSNSYVKYKIKDAEEIGIKAVLYKLSENISQEQMIDIVKSLNRDTTVDGIIIQLPLPDQLEIEVLQNYISLNKDVDGFRSDSDHSPCTPLGVINYLKYNDINLDGANVTVIGRGKTAGEPMARMLVDENATVSICHSHSTKDSLLYHCINADIVISAVGKPDLIKRYMINNNTICIDIGRGDFSEDVADEKRNIYVTPKIGGVGLLTRINLMANVWDAYTWYH